MVSVSIPSQVLCFRVFVLIGCSSVIIDEAQCIKNKNTRAAKAAWHLDALTRFCMSGTPMMNNVDELYSLIHFLRIKPYNEQEKFRRVSLGPCLSESS